MSDHDDSPTLKRGSLSHALPTLGLLLAAVVVFLFGRILLPAMMVRISDSGLGIQLPELSRLAFEVSGNVWIGLTLIIGAASLAEILWWPMGKKRLALAGVFAVTLLILAFQALAFLLIATVV
jgi:hypothetical protein